MARARVLVASLMVIATVACSGAIGVDDLSHGAPTDKPTPADDAGQAGDDDAPMPAGDGGPATTDLDETPDGDDDGDGGAPEPDYVFLRTVNAITLNHVDLAGANAMVFRGLVTNPSTITARGLWREGNPSRVYIQYETDDNDIVSAMSANDGAFSTSEDHFDFRLRTDLERRVDASLYQVTGNFLAAVLDASWPGGVRDASTSLNATVEVSGGTMLMAFDLPPGIGAESLFICNANARNRASTGAVTHAHLHGQDVNAMTAMDQFGVCKTSSVPTVPGAPIPDPSPGSPAIVDVSASGMTVQWDWDTASSSSGSGFVMYRVAGTSAYTSTAPVMCTGTSTGCSVALTGLRAGTTYEIVVVSRGADGTDVAATQVTQATSSVRCDYFASNTGGGTGLSQSSPFQIVDFWALGEAALRGKTLCLLDGVYRGSNSMIDPPDELNGTATQKITIRALNDGKVRIDAEYVSGRTPVRLRYNDHFVLEGFDACCINDNYQSSVITVGTGCENDTFRRICAWDGPNWVNAMVWSVSDNGGHHLFEDVCGFGTGRKTFGHINTHHVTIRRAWGQWERSDDTISDPNMVYTIMYNASDMTYENVIGTLNMPEDALPSDGFYGVLGMDHQCSYGWGTAPDCFCTRSRFLGSIAYLKPDSRFMGWAMGLIYGSRHADCFEFKDVVAYQPPGGALGGLKLRAIQASNFDGGKLNDIDWTCPSWDGTSCDRYVTSSTEIGGTDSGSFTEWKVSNRVDVDTTSQAPSIWNGSGSQGARVCKRYVDGVLTSEPLWPWPMDARIRNALAASGRNPDAMFDGAGHGVTEQMEALFGPIPAECRTP